MSGSVVAHTSRTPTASLIGGARLARAAAPFVIAAIVLAIPTPDGLSIEAWRFLALFLATIVGVIVEPIPAAAVGLTGVFVGAALQLVRPTPAASAAWALSGFSHPTVWLVFAACIFTNGYAKTGLGKRIALHLTRLMGRKTLGLGYAVMLSDVVLAPVTPSATGRSGCTIYPVVRHIPELYGSRPDIGTERKIGAYLLYTALATSAVSSSMFITALAPNTMAISLIQQTIHVNIPWILWFQGFLPVGIVLLALTPLLIYKIYPPEITEASEAPTWAAAQLREMGPITLKELTMLALVLVALGLWIAGGSYLDPALAAVMVVLGMVVFGLVGWNEVIGHSQAWNTLIWFATLIAMAGGLAETKFLDWLGQSLGPLLAGFSPYVVMLALVGAFFFLHYFFASITAHTATLFPVFLGVAVQMPGASPVRWALLLGYTLGLMGVLTSYGSGQNVVYYGSGYIKPREFWVLGLVVGSVYFAIYFAIIVPWLAFLGV